MNQSVWGKELGGELAKFYLLFYTDLQEKGCVDALKVLF